MFKPDMPKVSPSHQLALLAFFCFMGGTTSAYAAMSLGSIFCNGVQNARPFGGVFSWISYAGGVLAAVSGIHHLRLHADSPQNHRLTTPLAMLGGGAALLAMPSLLSAVITSIYGPGAGAGAQLTCTAGPVAGGPGLDQMLRGFISNIQLPMKMVVSAAALLSGLYMVVRGLMKASKYGLDPKSNSIHSFLTYIGFGALLITIGDNLDMMLTSVFGTPDVAPETVINWSKLSALVGGGGVSQRFIDAVNAALVFVQLIGAIAFVRGWLIMKNVVEGHSNVTLAQGMTHILGGVAAINIYQFLIAMDYTFGTNLIS